MHFFRLQLRRLKRAAPWLLALALLAGGVWLAERLQPGLIGDPARAALSRAHALSEAVAQARRKARVLGAEVSAAYATVKAIHVACADYPGEAKADCPDLVEPEAADALGQYEARQRAMEDLAGRLDALPAALSPPSLFPEAVTLTLAAGAVATFERAAAPRAGPWLLTPVTLVRGGPLGLRVHSDGAACLRPLPPRRLEGAMETLRLPTRPACDVRLVLTCEAAACRVILGRLGPPAPG